METTDPCLQQAMLIASDSYSATPTSKEFESFFHASACLSAAAYLPAAEATAYREAYTLN